MSVNLADIITENNPVLTPPRITVYSDEGMGKTTFGAQSPAPLLMRGEDGEGVLKIAMLPILENYLQMEEQLQALCSQQHEFLALVVDTVDHIEPLIWAETCRRNKWENIETPGYGKGYLAALDVWREYFAALNYLRNTKKMIIIQLAHAAAKKFANPETDTYDRYDIKLETKAAALLKETSDIVFFINKKVSIAQEDVGFNKKRKRAVGTNQRFLYCEQRAASTAKNRYNLPEQIEFDLEGKYWQVIGQHVPFIGNMLPKAESKAEVTNSTTTN